MECVLIEGLEFPTIDIAIMIDDWVEEHLDECAICTYYETIGSIQDRLASAIVNDRLITLIKIGLIMEGQNDENQILLER